MSDLLPSISEAPLETLSYVFLTIYLAMCIKQSIVLMKILGVLLKYRIREKKIKLEKYDIPFPKKSYSLEMLPCFMIG